MLKKQDNKTWETRFVFLTKEEVIDFLQGKNSLSTKQKLLEQREILADTEQLLV